ncbi:serine/threonine-protein kinase [Paraliomyxa miuraensis]|uniref:serine/threonine-protein kinase n=1 Tax=Paraliomyxa miuraensis TaxID=376150 RepID=UPI002257959F|nr:serine/threonine-protein kinase [Paraliomyxa miuraensis]MCX4246324.1 serine/threonine-protein kinase [Paraliomyxa miuraensis]
MGNLPHEIDTFDATASDAGPVLGELFGGRYRIDRCLGRGAMGTVYAAHDSVVNEDIALKLLSLPDGESTERFAREVRLARRVTHRNAARTFDLGEFEGVHFITMELVGGDSLRVRLAKQGRLPPDEVIELGRQVCLGLQAAHEVGVIHRDLKPANVIVDDTGRVVITDFGVACTVLEEAEVLGSRQPLAGTIMYMSPEQVVGAPIDHRADLYSLGILLYELLTGKSAFQGSSRTEIAMARLTRVPDPREHVPTPDQLAALVVRCLSQSIDERPPSAATIAQELAAMGTVETRPDESWPNSPMVANAASSMIGSLGASVVGTNAFFSTSPGGRALAVMPFRYRGPDDDAYLAEVLTDELVDLLAMTKGLRVSGSGATSQLHRERDARTVGRALGVDAIIDGSVQCAGTTVRIVARLIDVETGFQSWSERFEGELQDVFELQDRMAKRVAEGLRVELSVSNERGRVPGAAVELYLRGRQRLRVADISGQNLEEAIALFEQALERAPTFALALAARADAAVQRWFLPSARTEVDWGEVSRAAVLAALSGAPELAESHLAAARLHVSHGEFAAAARQLNAALEAAPTCAAAHEYLGLLQCDAGRSAEGVRHIQLAHELDPTLHQANFSVLRHYALRGDRAAYEAELSRLARSPVDIPFARALFEFRISVWHGEIERARKLKWRTEGAQAAIATLLRDALEPEHSDDELSQRFDQVAVRQSSPRFRTALRQFAVELLSWRGARELAMRQLAMADAGGVLVDADWFESCPAIVPLRNHPEFQAIQERVRERADAIWRTARD